MYQMRLFTALTPEQLEQKVNAFFLVNKDVIVVSSAIGKLDIYLTYTILFKLLD